MRVHPSNYRVEGFAHTPSVSQLAPVARQAGILLLDDVGSGAIADMALCGLPGEPGPREGLAAGADITLCSGDKLLGGPQAGIIAGRADLVEKVRTDPLFRAMRLDKLVLAALEATLRLHLDADRAWREIPVLALLREPVANLQARAEALAGRIHGLPWVRGVEARRDTTLVGGGSLPGMVLPTAVVAIQPEGMSVDDAARALRRLPVPVLARRKDDRLMLDLRSVMPMDDEELAEAAKSNSLV
jgi:L-seryl-tRNA(Ser) seleniumtransferase